MKIKVANIIIYLMRILYNIGNSIFLFGEGIKQFSWTVRLKVIKKAYGLQSNTAW